jgi:hypothetical protein
MNAFAEIDYLGEPVITSRGYQLCALLAVCEQAARSLDNVADGDYRDSITSSLAGLSRGHLSAQNPTTINNQQCMRGFVRQHEVITTEEYRAA